MKNQVKKLLMVTMLCMSSAIMCLGCSGKDDNNEAKKEITVTLKNGEETLGTLKGNAGEKLSGYEEYENIEGYEFLGWYETPSFIEPSKKDLGSDVFEDSTTLFGSFKNTQTPTDERVWTIVGAGSGAALTTSNWNNACEDDAVTFKSTDNHNEFTLTLDLYEGDKFQIIHDHDWADQRGFGFFTEIDDTQFENGGGLSGNDATSDVVVLMNGNYTITIVTDIENPALDEFKIVRNSDPIE